VNRRVHACLALVVAVFLTATVPASADRKDEINQKIRTLREQVEEASEAESELLGQLDDVQSRRRELDGKVATFDKQIAAAEGDVAAAQANLDRLQGEFVQAQMRLAAVEGEVADAQGELRKRAIAAYIGQPTAHAAELMLHADSMRDLAATATYLDAMVTSQKTVLDRYTSLRDEIVGLREAAAKVKDQALAQRNVIASRVAELEGARMEQDAVRQEVRSQEGQQAALVAQVRSRKAEFQAQINALQAESDAVGGLLRGVQDGQAVQGGAPGTLSQPLPGARITSMFGPRVHPITGDARNHNGIDYGAGTGTPIRAAGDGVVVYAGPRGGYGNATVIDHGGSLATLYAHQSSIGVAVGQSVGRGQVIGAVGSTGFSTGPHLHFEVRVQGTPVDPMRYL